MGNNGIDEALKTKLLKEVKGKLKISWEEEDEFLNELIESSYYYFHRNSSNLDLNTDLFVRGLLKERVRYEWNNALDEFETNFSKEIGAFLWEAGLEEDSDAK